MIDLTAIQEATEQMEMFAECEDYYRQNYRVVQPPELLFPAIHTALACLREAEEREKGCESCNGYKFAYSPTCEAMLNGDEIVVKANMILTVPFCPMCGRKLERSDT